MTIMPIPAACGIEGVGHPALQGETLGRAATMANDYKRCHSSCDGHGTSASNSCLAAILDAAIINGWLTDDEMTENNVYDDWTATATDVTLHQSLPVQWSPDNPRDMDIVTVPSEYLPGTIRATILANGATYRVEHDEQGFTSCYLLNSGAPVSLDKPVCELGRLGLTSPLTIGPRLQPAVRIPSEGNQLDTWLYLADLGWLPDSDGQVCLAGRIMIDGTGMLSLIDTDYVHGPQRRAPLADTSAEVRNLFAAVLAFLSVAGERPDGTALFSPEIETWAIENENAIRCLSDLITDDAQDS